ncbi:unnamed protein product [Protopolystoma xenopodis]|uniref:Uncharacterized protein n=1 Tax=Protopolystoma xenopodis TaxID=117903 RepID=A0A448XST9_9PLAT|nr:unnamed protein product [Protopolystoma xenopodis]
MLSTPNNLDLPAHDSSVDANAASFSSAQSIISQNPLSSLSPDSGKLNDTQMSVLLTALAFPISLGGRYSWMGPWGPLLRYGTYGRLPENQLAVRDRFHDLLIREADKQRSLNINYVEELSMFIEKTVRINAVYLFTQLHRLPKEEQAYYLDGLALKVCQACGFYLIISSLP